MVKFVLKNDEKFVITDDLYESILNNGGVILFEDNSLNKKFSREEKESIKNSLYNHFIERTKEKISQKYGIQAKDLWLKNLSTPINSKGTDIEQTTTEGTIINKELRKILDNDFILDSLYSDFLNLLKDNILSYSLDKKTEQLADESLHRFQQQYEREIENNNDKQIPLPLNNKNDDSTQYNDIDDNDNDNDKNIDEKFDNDIDIDSDKREVFIKEALKDNKLPLFNENFKEIVGQKKIDVLEDLYNNLYYCGNTKLKAKTNIFKLQKKYKNLEEFYEKRDEQTQNLFNSITKKWWDNVYQQIKKYKPNQAKALDKLLLSIKKEDDDYDLQQEFALKGKAANKIIQRIIEIMKNVGKINYLNYVFTNVSNLSTIKKYYLTELQSNASYGDNREYELNKIKEIRNADNSLFQQISKRLLIHGNINEYIKVIRFDDVLDGVFTVTRTERATTLGHQRTILTFTEKSTHEVMFILIIEPTFGALKKMLNDIDISGIKNSLNKLDSKL